MKRLFHILLVASVCLALAGCEKKPEIIPQDDFGQLYVELLLADQWVKAHPSERRIADTSFVYSEVLRKHGYTDEQVIASMKYYLEDPLRYKRAMDVAVAKLEKHYNEVDAELTIRRHVKEFMGKYHRDSRPDTVWTRPSLEIEGLDSLTLRVRQDTLYWQRIDSLLSERPMPYFQLKTPIPSASL